jgi:DnaK suppressor protein
MPALKKRKTTNEEFRNLLLEKRKELQDKIEQRRSEILIERDPDDEGAQALQSVASDLAMANMEREVRTLAEIELSLRRIAAGEYGKCGSCGEPIPDARLHALPWTRLCVECAGGSAQTRTQAAAYDRPAATATEESKPARPFLVKSGSGRNKS